MPTIIYLDQNKWIRLLQQREGKITSPEMERTLNLLTSAAENGSAILPISQSHLIETATVNDTDRRERLFEFLLITSRNWVLSVFNIVGREEITAYFQQFNGENVNWQSIALGKGLPFLIGGDNWYLTHEGGDSNKAEIAPETLEEMSEAISDRDAFEIGWRECVEILRSREYEKDLVGELEKTREQHEKKFSDNERRRRVVTMKYYLREIAPELVHLCVKNGKDPHTLPADFSTYLTQGEDAEDTTNFLQSFPSNYTYVTLTATRDIQKHRDIERNDLHDIMALSVAIPYCDIVVTENFWTHEAKRNDLHSLYGTKVISDLNELDGLISV